MEHWEFLLQKEGDRSWLPLESPNVEILEGRYQVLARSSLIDTKINVQVSHFFNRHGVPAEQIQSCFQKTNSQGVVVVIPFTYLQPGRWQLACTPSGTDQQNAWCQSIQLQVLYQESDVPEDWESLNWQEQSLKESMNQPDVTKEVQRHEAAPVTALSQDDNQVAASLNSPHVAQSASSSTSQQIKTSSLRLPNFTSQAQSSRLKVSEGYVFPPQLSQSHPSNVVRKSPELPVVPRPKVSSVDIEIVRSYLEQASLQKPTLVLEHQPLLVETAFEALKLKERFRSRLNTLAKTETRVSLESDVTPQDLAGSKQENLDTSQTNLLVDLDQSQVSESKLSAAVTDSVNSLEPHQENEALPVSATELTDSQPLIAVDPVESDQIVPIPDLVLPEEELVMGQPITVHVTLPDPSTPLYVKLWIKDRQTRSLLDGPRWLVEFVSNETGVLEASTQLMVPLGSLEVSFEAIAINMQTKSESYKATVNRPVMPLGMFLVEDANS